MRGWAKIGGLGALGLVAAAVLAALSLQLVSQPVGLSSEPLTAGNRLAPAEHAKTDAGATRAAAQTGKPPVTTATTGATSSPRGDNGQPGGQSRPGGDDDGQPGGQSPRGGGDNDGRNDD